MKRCKNKRKLAVLGLAAAMALSLAACGEKRPSQEDVEQSIEAGTLTIEDALDKGWVDQAWVDAYYEENSVPAASKTESNMVGDFATTTLSGEAFTREQLGDVVFFAFLDPEAEGTQVFYNALAEGYGGRCGEWGGNPGLHQKRNRQRDVCRCTLPRHPLQRLSGSSCGQQQKHGGGRGDAKRRLLVCERSIPLCMVFRRGRRGAACVRGRLCGDEPERRVPVWDGGRGRRRYGGYGLI